MALRLSIEVINLNIKIENSKRIVSIEAEVNYGTVGLIVKFFGDTLFLSPLHGKRTIPEISKDVQFQIKTVLYTYLAAVSGKTNLDLLINKERSFCALEEE